MRAERINDEVLVAAERIVRIDREDIASFKVLARRNSRHRIRLCAHHSSDDLLHEMLIVLDRETYVRPHRHKQKSESFHVVEGVLDVVIFDDQGGVADVIHMGDYASGRQFFYRLSDAAFHTVVVHSDLAVFHETTNGPFRRSETEFASWAPEESQSPEVGTYMAALRDRIAEQFVSAGISTAA